MLSFTLTLTFEIVFCCCFLYYYYILDLPSMAWSLGFRDLTADDLMEIYAVSDEPHIPELHTGITGAMLNVRLYQVLLQHAAERRN